MGFLDNLRKALAGPSGEAGVYWIYAQCGRCGEPLRGRVDLRNEPSLGEGGKTWIVRKGLMGSGDNRCFQTVDVTLRFDARKQKVIDSEVSGGKLITEEEYDELMGD